MGLRAASVASTLSKPPCTSLSTFRRTAMLSECLSRAVPTSVTMSTIPVSIDSILCVRSFNSVSWPETQSKVLAVSSHTCRSSVSHGEGSPFPKRTLVRSDISAARVIYTYIHIHTHIHIEYICMYIYIYIHISVCICMYACMHQACMHACMYVCMHVCMYVCMYVCIYIYIHVHLLVHLYVYSNSRCNLSLRLHCLFYTYVDL